MSDDRAQETKELTLIGKVEFRIAAAESDAKLEGLLHTYLTPLLLKLASEHQSVRNKVISVCQHVNARIKAPNIKLPTAALLKQFKENQNTLIRHFDLLYIQQGVERLPQSERLDLLPVLLKGLAQNHEQSQKHAATLFNLFLRLLHQFKLPPRGSKEDLELRTRLALDDPADAAFVAVWIGKLFLYNAAAATTKSCPGLSVSECEFLQLYDKPETWSPSSPGGLNLIETKVLAAKFLASGGFEETERFLPALFASADMNSRLADLGDDMMKRALPAVSKEDSKLVDELYKIYLGFPADHVLPASTVVQTKVLAVLSTSQIATSRTSQILEIVQGSLTTDQRTGNTGPKGLAASKLRTQVFNFVTWIARMGKQDQTAKIAPDTVASLREYIESQGWPTVADELKGNSSELQLRAFGYESIGLLAKAAPNGLLYEDNLDLLRWFFQSLGGDAASRDVSLSIEQAMSSILAAFSHTGKEIIDPLVGLLSHYASLTPDEEDASGITMHRSTRYTAVRFSNRCLPFSDVHGRMIALLALAGGDTERREVIEEGRRGIDPYWYRILNPANGIGSDETHGQQMYGMPRFEELTGTLLSPKDNPLYSSRAFGDAVVFCCTVLLHNALESISRPPVIDTDWQRNIEALVQNDEVARDGVKKYLRDLSGPQAEALLHLSRSAFADYVRPSSTIRPLSGKALLELWQLGPSKLLADSNNLDRASELESTIFSNFNSARILSGRLFGLMSTQKGFYTPQNTKFLLKLFETAAGWKTATGAGVHHVHGSILAISYGISRVSNDTQNDTLASRRTAFIEMLFQIFKTTRDKELVDAVLLAVSQLSLYGLLTPDVVKDHYDVEEFLKKIQEMAKKGEEVPVTALGRFAMQCKEEDPDLPVSKIVTILYDLHEVRQAEVQFSVGAALSCAAIGWESKDLIGMHDVEGPTPKFADRVKLLEEVIDKVLNDCKTTKPALRQASVIRLLCLIQYCGHKEEIMSRLRQCQAAFKSFLSDKDSVNQEVASRGLTLVYEKGDRSLKDDLIKDLVTSFTSTKSNLAGNVSEETELFEAGALPTTEGQSVTTYKDIISLANEVGDPSLVYRFMSLASNSSIWSTRSAFGRFGLSRILSDASVDGYLAHNPKLYSSLFRYRFDPNTNVRSAMNEIWTSLVKDSKATIDQYFDNILQDLFKSILTKEWRTRQASCAAIADLLQGRPLAMYEQYLTKIWELTFKVCDDIKGSVRTAAMALARVLTGILTRSLEAGDASASTANAMLKQVLPFLLGTSGLESSAQEVQSFSLVTLIDIIKKANAKTLRPFIADLIGRLLSLLSSIEPGMINYVYLNADKYGITEQQIDDARLSSVKMSPMMEAIERCLDMLDETSMKEVEASLVNAVKTVIGLPSRVGVCRVMVSLATRHRFLFQPYAGRFLKLLRRQLLDRNDTISTSAAAACGYLARLASDEEILQLVEYSKKLYFESEDNRHRTIAGELLLAVAKHATDRFASLASACLPFAYFGLHDTYDASKDLFKAAWEENAGGSRAVLLYLREIIDLSVAHFDSPHWAIKHTSAFTISDTIKAESEISDANAAIIWPALKKAIGGKTWEGKEKVLEAFVMFWKRADFTRSQDVKNAMKEIAVREAKRNNVAYRVHGLKALADMIEDSGTSDKPKDAESIDWFDTGFDIVAPILQEYLDSSDTEKEDKMDVDAKIEGGLSSKDTAVTTVAHALRVALVAIPTGEVSSKKLTDRLSNVLPLVKKAMSDTTMSSRSNVLLDTLLDASAYLFTSMSNSKLSSEGKLDKECVDLSTAILFVSQYSDLNEALRQKIASTALAASKLAAGENYPDLRKALNEGMEKCKTGERSQTVLSVWNKTEEQLRAAN